MSEGRNLRSSLLWTSRRVVVGFAVAIFTLVLVSGVTLNALSRRTLNDQTVSRSFTALRMTHRLLAEVDASQLALTDFILTGDPRQLEPYQSARTSIPATLDELEALTTRRLAAREQLGQLRPVLEKALELDAREAAGRLGGATLDDLQPMMLQSRTLLTQAASIIDRLRDDTAQLLKTEQAALEDSIRGSTFVVVAGDLVLLALILGAAAVTFRDAADRAHTVQFQRRMLGMVGHDLRNPLSVVMMSATQLAKTTDGGDRRQVTVSRILGAAHRMEKMIRDLLDYSRIELHIALPLDVQPSDVHSCCQRVLDEFRTVHPGRDIRYEPGDLSQVSWDSDRIERVLENLVSNAIKYSPSDTPVYLGWRRDEDRVIIEVRNRGAPIPETVMPHIFEAFRRGENHDAAATKQSHGLGLYIVRHIVLQHGGDIQVQSSAAAGTTFTVALPQPVRAPAAA